MRLYLNVEEATTEHDYTAVCYAVRDYDSDEVIWRTADKKKAELLVGKFNDGCAVGVLENKIDHQQEAFDRLNARYKRAVSALKEIATCVRCDDCGLCHVMACPDQANVATARAALRALGLKIPTAEKL